jgi:nucleoside-diphosphate-sugar epimerase
MTIVRPSHTYDKTGLPVLGGYTTVGRMRQGKKVVVHGDGTSLWTLTHHRDFAKGFVGLMGNSHAIGEAVHITSDEVLSWNQIYQLTAAAVGCEAKIVHVASDQICKLDPDYTGSLLGDKSESALFDNSKIKQLVPNFKATTPYAEGIKQTVAWFEEDPTRKWVDQGTDAFIEQLIQRQT